MSLIYTSPISRHNLYLGGKVDAKSRSTLQQRNVKRILNVTPAKEAGITAGVPNYFENNSRLNITYKRISVYDNTTSDLLPYAEDIVTFISNGLHHGSVLVHCQRGVSRSATSVIMFLMRKANMTMNQSLKLCQRRRPIVDPNPAFMNQLRTFERECREGGHLTSVDIQDVNVGVNEKDIGKNDVDRGVRNDIGPCVGGKKRKGENIGCGNDGWKKRMVGPIGPSRGHVAAIGPAMPPPSVRNNIGPNAGGDKTRVKNDGCDINVGRAKRTVGPIGPLRGPVAAIGPAMPPSKEGTRNNIGPSAGGEKKKVENVGVDNIVKKKRTVGPIGPSRGPVNSAAIGPAMPPPDTVPSEKK